MTKYRSEETNPKTPGSTCIALFVTYMVVAHEMNKVLELLIMESRLLTYSLGLLPAPHSFSFRHFCLQMIQRPVRPLATLSPSTPTTGGRGSSPVCRSDATLYPTAAVTFFKTENIGHQQLLTKLHLVLHDQSACSFPRRGRRFSG
jgi:hypothetical protein